MVVVKFGGSILDGSEGIKKVCDEVAQLPRPLLLVVSAFADVTNRLEQLAATALDDHDAAVEKLGNLFRDHSVIAGSVLSETSFRVWETQAAEWEHRLGEIVRGLSIVKELSPRTLDLVVHFGERLSSSIVAARLDVPCISATELMITNPRHRYARADMVLSRERVEEKLGPLFHGDPVAENSGVVVTEGYIGRSTEGEVTTMGRESSDFSATFFGELLGADDVRIYTGVPGVLTADPKIVSGAETIPAMSYGMARELAVLGAKVLHPRTVRPAERAGFPLTITDLAGNRTVISSGGENRVFSVAALESAALITLELRETDEDITAFAAELARNVPLIRTVRSGRLFHAVAASMPSGFDRMVRKSSAGIVGHDARPAALVSLVRERRADASDAGDFIGAVGRDDILSFWTDPNERSVSALVPPDRLNEVVEALHRQFLAD